MTEKRTEGFGKPELSVLLSIKRNRQPASIDPVLLVWPNNLGVRNGFTHFAAVMHNEISNLLIFVTNNVNADQDILSARTRADRARNVLW